MTVGEFCKYLNSNDLIIIRKSDGGFASGLVSEMSVYFDEELLHINADKYPGALRINKNIGYEIDVA